MDSLKKPLVSVICLCHNHGKYVEHAIFSVLNQKYDNVELIVVDDASDDASREIIPRLSKKYGFKTIENKVNLGNCSSFNLGLSASKGKYLIDLAADDYLYADRVKIGVEVLEKLGKSYGVHFCDVEQVNEYGRSLGTHFLRDKTGKLINEVPTGDIYQHLVEKYLISAPSMMMSRKVLEELNGYDEDLSYEDFDFWVRSSRNYKYAFTDMVLIKKLVLKNSLSSIQYQKKNPHLMSTAKVCEKILSMNTNKQEDLALLKRINYESKWALITENWEAEKIFILLKEKLDDSSFRLSMEKLIVSIKPSWYWLWKLLLRI